MISYSQVQSTLREIDHTGHLCNVWEFGRPLHVCIFPLKWKRCCFLNLHPKKLLYCYHVHHCYLKILHCLLKFKEKENKWSGQDYSISPSTTLSSWPNDLMLIEVLMTEQYWGGHADKSMTAANPEIWVFKKKKMLIFNNPKYSNFKKQNKQVKNVKIILGPSGENWICWLGTPKSIMFSVLFNLSNHTFEYDQKYSTIMCQCIYESLYPFSEGTKWITWIGLSQSQYTISSQRTTPVIKLKL